MLSSLVRMGGGGVAFVSIWMYVCALYFAITVAWVVKQ